VKLVPVQFGNLRIAFNEEDVDEVFSHGVHVSLLKGVVTAASPNGRSGSSADRPSSDGTGGLRAHIRLAG
jgi:hypothetical protein